MNNTIQKITRFEDLNTWKEGHKLAVTIYKLTDKFPSKEIFSLTDQMRRAAVSVTSNVAEGFTRQGTKEKIQFYLISKGSLTELQSQLYIAKDIGYLKIEQFLEVMNQTITVHKLLTGLIKGASSFGTEHSS
jgi:four helix bundle protein